MITNASNTLLDAVSTTTPYIVKYIIGYCHFYYQLGYGLIFYIYFFRRYKAKRANNWKSFYGNSILNWFLLNISIFNKFLFNRNFIVYTKNTIVKAFQVSKFLLNQQITKNITLNKISTTLVMLNRKYKLNNWTPLFKRSSYIWFTTFLKRFTKRK